MIAGACPTPATGDAFLATLLGHIDCQAQAIGAGGYHALAATGSPLALALTALVTVFVALFGLGMVLGGTPSLRDGVVAVAKVGVVLLLATSWSAYRTLVYDVVVHGPAELAGAIGGPSALPGAGGGLVERLQRADDAVTMLTTLGSGRTDLSSAPPLATDGTRRELPRAPITDDLAFGLARVALLAGTIGAFVAVRLGTGVLLALAPLFAGLLLFEATRSLFAGWLRALVAAMLAALAVAIVLGVELALLEPWLTGALQLRFARIITPAAPIELLVLCLGFAIALGGSIWMIARLAFAVHLPAGWRTFTTVRQAAERRGHVAGAGAAGAVSDGWHPSRALAVADAVAAVQRREAAHPAGASRPVRVTPSGHGGRVSPDDARSPGVVPLGQTFRRTRTRVSPGAARRDRRS